MAYDFKPFQKQIAETEEWLKQELLTVQTGRATPAMLDSVKVDSYGSKVAINQVANVTAEDARTLRITPWDTNNLQAIETALRDADLGCGVSSDEKGVRLSFPELTTETREKYVKVVGKKLEEAKVSLRAHRDDVWNDIQKQQKDGEISEDDKFRFKEEMEKLTKEAAESLENDSKRKEEDLMQ